MHILFFSHNLLFPLLIFLILIVSQHALAADPNLPSDRPLLALNKAVRDFNLPLDDSTSPKDQGALLSLAPDPGTNGQDGSPAPPAPPAAASLVSASNQCSNSAGNSRTAENKKRRRRSGTDTESGSGSSSSGEGCGWDEGGKESGTNRETDYDNHIPDSFVDRSKHQFFYPAQLQEDPSTCNQPLSTPVCDDGSYMISKPDPRASSSPFHFTLPFCRPQFLYRCQWPERLWCCFRALRNDAFPEVLSDVIIYTYTGYRCILSLENLLPADPANHRPL